MTYFLSSDFAFSLSTFADDSAYFSSLATGDLTISKCAGASVLNDSFLPDSSFFSVSAAFSGFFSSSFALAFTGSIFFSSDLTG